MAPLSTQTKRRHRVFLLGLFTTLLVFSSLFTYFMLMPFSKFSAASSAASGGHDSSGDGGSNIPSQQQQQQHKLTGSIIRADLRALQKSSREAEFAPPPQKHQQQHRDSPHEDEFWREDVLFPPNGGYFAVIGGGPQQQQQEQQQQQQQGSGDAVTGADGGLGLAMFHQLRCLTTLRAEMQRLRDVVTVLEGSGENGGDGLKRRRAPGSPMMYDEAHCFEYLRQSLLCSSDATIERPKLRDDGKLVIDGMGKRTCKDWDILYRASARTDRDPILPNDV